MAVHVVAALAGQNRFDLGRERVVVEYVRLSPGRRLRTGGRRVIATGKAEAQGGRKNQFRVVPHGYVSPRWPLPCEMPAMWCPHGVLTSGMTAVSSPVHRIPARRFDFVDKSCPDSARHAPNACRGTTG